MLLFLLFRGMPLACGEREVGMEFEKSMVDRDFGLQDFHLAWAYAGTRGIKVSLKGGFCHPVCFDDAVCQGPEF